MEGDEIPGDKPVTRDAYWATGAQGNRARGGRWSTESLEHWSTGALGTRSSLLAFQPSAFQQALPKLSSHGREKSKSDVCSCACASLATAPCTCQLFRQSASSRRSARNAPTLWALSSTPLAATPSSPASVGWLAILRIDSDNKLPWGPAPFRTPTAQLRTHCPGASIDTLRPP